MITYSFERFTSTCTIVVYDTPPPFSVATLAQYCTDLCDAVEQQCSRFLSTSTLSLLNTGSALLLPDHIHTLIQHACRLLQTTEGRFNPFVSVASLGYTQSLGSESTVGAPDNQADLTQASSMLIHTDPTTGLTQLESGWTLDLGGIGKGYVVDCVGAWLTSQGATNRFINFGGDLLVQGTPPGKNAFCIAIDDPLQPGRDYGVLDLAAGSLCTSGSYKRHRTREAQPHHHIIDPYTGKNQRAIISASVISPDAVTSDGFATAVMTCATPEEGIAFLEYNGRAGMLIDAQGKAWQTKDFSTTYQYD